MSGDDDGGNKRQGLADWKRPDGPPIVWKIVEGRERLDDGTTKPIRFSIQDVLRERYHEAVEHMCKYFMADEATCKSLKLKDDPNAIDDFSSLWYYLLEKGISVAAYKLDSNDRPLELAGVNMLYMSTDESEKAIENFMKNFKSEKAKKLFKFIYKVAIKIDVLDIYDVETYISALGLSVNPKFRGQKLGVILLETRNDIGRKYGITATETIFTSPSSQIQAERAGFETLLEQEYEQVKDENGEPLFPNIMSKSLKIMGRRLM